MAGRLLPAPPRPRDIAGLTQGKRPFRGVLLVDKTTTSKVARYFLGGGSPPDSSDAGGGSGNTGDHTGRSITSEREPRAVTPFVGFSHARSRVDAVNLYRDVCVDMGATLHRWIAVHAHDVDDALATEVSGGNP